MGEEEEEESEFKEDGQADNTKTENNEQAANTDEP
jgi:hypothetical protein